MSFLIRFFPLFFCTILLVGCFGDNSSSAVDEVDSSGLIKHTATWYSLRVPASWEEVDVKKIVAPVEGKIEFMLRSLVNKRGFMNNLIILSDSVMNDVTSSEYISQSMLWASREYLSLTMDRDEQIAFLDGQTSRLVIYRAKYNETTEEHLFMQTARVCGKTVYLLTLGLENDTPAESYDRYRPIFTSFTCQ
jgi:hypothetical protein